MSELKTIFDTHKYLGPTPLQGTMPRKAILDLLQADTQGEYLGTLPFTLTEPSHFSGKLVVGSVYELHVTSTQQQLTIKRTASSHANHIHHDNTSTDITRGIGIFALPADALTFVSSTLVLPGEGEATGRFFTTSADYRASGLHTFHANDEQVPVHVGLLAFGPLE